MQHPVTNTYMQDITNAISVTSTSVLYVPDKHNAISNTHCKTLRKTIERFQHYPNKIALFLLKAETKIIGVNILIPAIKFFGLAMLKSDQEAA